MGRLQLTGVKLVHHRQPGLSTEFQPALRADEISFRLLIVRIRVSAPILRPAVGAMVNDRNLLLTGSLGR